MADTVIDSLANRILELEHNIEQTDGHKQDRFIAIDSEVIYKFTQVQQNANTRRVTERHIRLFVTWLQCMNELRQPEEIDHKI